MSELVRTSSLPRKSMDLSSALAAVKVLEAVSVASALFVTFTVYSPALRATPVVRVASVPASLRTVVISCFAVPLESSISKVAVVIALLNTTFTVEAPVCSADAIAILSVGAAVTAAVVVAETADPSTPVTVTLMNLPT